MVLKLYNAGMSVCSVKVRIALAEKQLEWEDVLLSLPKGEQFNPDYLKLNPNGVVPTLIHDDLVILESSVIIEYIDQLNDDHVLMPETQAAKIATKIWLLRCLEIHAAINTMTFSTVKRAQILADQTPQQIADSIAKMPNPKMADKRQDLITNGIDSRHVLSDFFTLKKLFDDMQSALEKTRWLTGNDFGLSDVALIAYIDRLDRLGMAGLWQERTPRVGEWLEAARNRPSYQRAMDRYVSKAENDKTTEIGASLWPEVKQKWEAFLAV